MQNNNTETPSKKDMYLTSITYYFIAVILNNLSENMILDITEQIAMDKSIDKQYFISTFDYPYIQDILTEILVEYVKIADEMLTELNKEKKIIL